MSPDYLAIRSSRKSFDTDAGTSAFRRENEVGSPCSGATDKEACLTALEGPLDQSWFPAQLGYEGQTRYQIIWTRNDEVGIIATREELLDFLGTIDTPSEAALIARFILAHDSVCDAPRATPRYATFSTRLHRMKRATRSSHGSSQRGSTRSSMTRSARSCARHETVRF